MVKERRWSGKEFEILSAATQKLRLPSSDLVVDTYIAMIMSLMPSSRDWRSTYAAGGGD